MLVLVITVATVISAVNGQSILIGGKRSSVAEYPFQVSFQLPSGLHYCSGFLFSSTMVVTAAHCVFDVDHSKIQTYKIRAGSSSFTKGGQLVQVERSIVHPGFNAMTNDNDIALLKLASAITVTNAKFANILPDYYEYYPNVYLNITGWGTAQEGNDIPEHVQVMQLKTITSEACEKIYRTKKITTKQFCVISPDKSTCSADCGASAVMDGTIYGIFSMGINCADSVYPAIYTRIAFFRQWIFDNAGKKRRQRKIRTQIKRKGTIWRHRMTHHGCPRNQTCLRWVKEFLNSTSFKNSD